MSDKDDADLLRRAEFDAIIDGIHNLAQRADRNQFDYISSILYFLLVVVRAGKEHAFYDLAVAFMEATEIGSEEEKDQVKIEDLEEDATDDDQPAM
jgi:hypothetical protein